MTVKEALDILTQMYEYQVQFKKKCDSCIPNKQLEALKICIEKVKGIIWLNANYKLSGKDAFNIVSTTALVNSFNKEAITRDIDIVRNELEVLDIIKDTIISNNKKVEHHYTT